MPFGSGDFTYEVQEGWAKLPEGYEFREVAAVAVDEHDQVYMFNRSDNKMVVFDRDGNLVRTWGQTFVHPHGMRIGPDGNIYFVDQWAHVVLKYSPDEELLLTLGTRDQPSDTGYTLERKVVERAAGPFNNPTGVAIAENGDIYVSDGYGNSRLHRYDASGSLITSWGVPGKVNPGEFHVPHGVGVHPDGRVLLCDRENDRIQIFDQEGKFLGMWTGFTMPCSVTIGPDGTVYVPELRSRFSIVDANGEVLARWGGESSHEPGQFVAPHCVAVDSRGDIYVGEVLEGKRLQKFIRQ